MKPSTAYQDTQTFSLLLIGDPGTGKSRVMASFPGAYIQDWDRNLKSVMNVEPSLTFMYDDPYTADDGKSVPAPDLWDVNIDGRLKKAAFDPAIKTLCVDGVAMLSDALQEHIRKLVKKQEGKSIETLRQQDWGTFRIMMLRLITFLRSTGKLIVFTSHQRVEKDEVSGILNYKVNIPGQLGDNIGGIFSDVWGTESNRADPPKFNLVILPSIRHAALKNSLLLEFSDVKGGKKISRLDMTDLKPSDIWKLIGPKIEGQVKKI